MNDHYLQFEDAKLRAAMAAYPEDIREDCIWLGIYTREHCTKSLASLSATIKKLGWEIHDTTLSRILRGKMFDDSGKPLVRLRTLNAIVSALRKDAQLAQLSGSVPFIETSTWELFRDYIDAKRAPDTICKFGLIIGPTGSQKTHCAKHYCLLNNHGVCVHVEVPEHPSMTKFMAKLAKKYGASEFNTIEKQRLRILENVSDKSTIIIDNIQRMYVERHGWSQPIFNYLQQLQDDSGCTIILIAVPEFEVTLTNGINRGYFEQFEGRVGGRSEFLILPEHSPEEDALAIAQAYGLVDAAKHLPKLMDLARRRGRIRILFNALQKAKRLAGEQPLTLTWLKKAIGEES